MYNLMKASQTHQFENNAVHTERSTGVVFDPLRNQRRRDILSYPTKILTSVEGTDQPVRDWDEAAGDDHVRIMAPVRTDGRQMRCWACSQDSAHRQGG